MAIESWPAALRAHGIQVQLHNGFPNTPKPRGDMPDRIASFFWHHDATPAGATPGGLSWMIDSYVAGKPCAQIWIDTKGVWHFVGAGYASHAGVVKGSLTSANSVGAETDHTINETYPSIQLDSIRKGVAVCAIQEGRNADWLTFHKWEASPFGRKVDPWFDGESNDLSKWDDELKRERAIVQRFIDEIKNGGITPPDPTEDELSAAEVEVILGAIKAVEKKVDAVNDRVNALEDNQYFHREDGSRIYEFGRVDEATHNKVDALSKKVADLETRIFDRREGSQSVFDEIRFATEKQILPAIRDVLAPKS